MEQSALRKVWKLPNLSPAGKLVYSYLEYIEDNRTCQVSLRSISSAVGMQTPSVSVLIKRLMELGIIQRVQSEPPSRYKRYLLKGETIQFVFNDADPDEWTWQVVR